MTDEPGGGPPSDPPNSATVRSIDSGRGAGPGVPPSRRRAGDGHPADEQGRDPVPAPLDQGPAAADGTPRTSRTPRRTTSARKPTSAAKPADASAKTSPAKAAPAKAAPAKAAPARTSPAKAAPSKPARSAGARRRPAHAEATGPEATGESHSKDTPDPPGAAVLPDEPLAEAASLEQALAGGLAFLRRRITGDYEVDDFGFDADLTEHVVAAAAAAALPQLVPGRDARPRERAGRPAARWSSPTTPGRSRSTR